MKVSLAQVVPSLGRGEYRAFVLYGTNNVLIQGIIQEINHCFTHTTISGDSLVAYRDDLMTPLLFGKKPVVTYVERSLDWSVMTPVLRTWPQNYAVVLSSSSIPPSLSKLSEIAVVACYDCTLGESKTIVQRYSQRMQLGLSSSVLNWCANAMISGQWHNMMHVLGLFAEEKSLEISDLKKIFPEYWDPLDLAILDPMAVTFCPEDLQDPLKILRSWQRTIMQLWQLKHFFNDRSQTMKPEQALGLIRPPVFFKHKEPLINAVKTWSQHRIARCFTTLIQGEIDLKKNILNGTAVLLRILRQG